nr:MarC family protein [Oceaniferula flavus]
MCGIDLVLSTAVTLFIVLDPFGNLAVFNSVLASQPEAKRNGILVRELTIALVVLMFFLFCGRPVLDFLNLQQSTLRISGGLILFLVSLGMVFPAKSVLGGEEGEEPFIVPLAIPLMAGPSAIIYLLLLSNQHAHVIGNIAIATFLAWMVSATILLASPFFMRILGRKGTRALERLMGMLLVMISVQMFMDGLAEYQSMH